MKVVMRLLLFSAVLIAVLSINVQAQTDASATNSVDTGAASSAATPAPVQAVRLSKIEDEGSAVQYNKIIAMNKEKIENAQTKRHSFLVAGGFLGFLVWMAMFVNSGITLFLAVLVFTHVRRNRIYPRDLVQRVKQILADGELGFAMEACVPGKTPLSRILFEAFKNIGDGFEACRDAMQIAVKAETEKLHKPVRAIVTCGIFSICLGLLGASLGVMDVFSTFADNPEIGNFQQAALELCQTTYFLTVGIIGAGIAFLLHHYADGKVARIIVNTEKIAYDLIKVLRGVHVAGELPDMSTMTQLINYNSLKNIPVLKKK
jgi:biopolymer transport protein ExbB/TolQ